MKLHALAFFPFFITLIHPAQATDFSISLHSGTSFSTEFSRWDDRDVPRRCARCRHIQNRSDFLDCLDRCLENRPIDRPWHDDRSPAWQIDTMNHQARKQSDNGFNTQWGKREYGEIAVFEDWGRPALSFSIGSLSFDPFDAAVEIIINHRSYGRIDGDVKNNTIIIQDPTIIEAMRYARKVEMKVTPWNHTPLHFHYTMGRDFGSILRQFWRF